MTQLPIAVVREKDWWVRPRVVLPVLVSLLLLVALLTPEPAMGRLGDDRLSSHLAGPLGARALKETASRLGWHVVQRDSSATPTATPGATVHAVLAPPLHVTPIQSHRYLDAVRAGDGLLIALGQRSALSDSLGLGQSTSGGVFAVQVSDSTGCGARGHGLVPALWLDGQAHLSGLRWRRGRPHDAVGFAQIRKGGREQETALDETAAGFSLGKGRVVVVADPDMLRNDVLQHCEWGLDVVAVRMIEWLRAGGVAPRTTLAFDELHQGFGPQSSPTSVTGRFLGGHPVGRTIVQLVFGALVLLLALAPRPVRPRRQPRTERRDSLEQTDALAHAYQQVRAKRTATELLLRGVRSRVEHMGGAGRPGDDAFLAGAAAAHPARVEDVARVYRALHSPHDSDQLPEIGAALRRIEDSLTTTMSSRA